MRTQRTRKKDVFAIFDGLDHVISKSTIRGDQLAKKGYDILFYSFEVRKSPKLGYPIVRISKIYLFDLFCFSFLLLKRKPKYVEIYFEGNAVSQLLHVLVLNAFDVLSIAILRGELYYYHSTMSALKKQNLKYILNIVDFIYYRETYMLNILQRMVKNTSKIVFDSNKVRYKKDYVFQRNNNNVLFLNGFKKWRRLDLIIDAIPIVNSHIKGVEFVFVGARSNNELNYYKNLINKKGLQNVSVHKWTENSQDYYEKASVFVLPADLVFLNFSLLEAMERGVVPIVSKVKDADKIICNNKDGLIVPQDSVAFAEAIISLLSDKKKLQRMSLEARNKIFTKYNDKDRMSSIIEKINNKYN
jgi:glycosyltransferase involved in cell wall biosynthesis